MKKLFLILFLGILNSPTFSSQDLEEVIWKYNRMRTDPLYPVDGASYITEPGILKIFLKVSGASPEYFMKKYRLWEDDIKTVILVGRDYPGL